MTPHLPVVSSKNMIRALERAGFYIHRQSGSHVILKRDSDKRRVTVPCHGRDLHIGTFVSILHQAGLSSDEFLLL
mgnify:CR=1 FL=1